MRPQLQDLNRGVSSSDIQEFEDELGRALPTDYREFLLRSNGGVFHDHVITPEYDRVDLMYGLNTGLTYTDLRFVLREARNTGLLPEGMLPIASTNRGDHICLMLDEPNRGAVFSETASLEYDFFEPKYLCDSFVDFMSSLHVDPESLIDQYQKDPAFLAISAGQIDKLRNMLSSTLDCNARNEHGATLLMYAALKCRFDMVDLLLAEGADIHTRDQHGQTAVFYAVMTDSVDGVTLLAGHGADVNAIDSDGEFPLIETIKRDGITTALKLIELGADVNYRSPHGETPLRCCDGLIHDYELLQERLIAAGAKE